jgi:rhomboid protease GluP
MNDPNPLPGPAGSPPSYDGQARAPQMVRVRMPYSKPWVTYTIMGITIFIYLLQLAGQYLLGTDIVALYGVKVNELIAAGEVWRLFTPMLLHGSLLHIAFNMYALYAFGARLELFYGHWRFLAMYLVAGFAGNVLSYTFSTSVSLGASTAIYGLLGAEGIFLFRNWKLFGNAARRDLQNLVILLVVNLLIGLNARFDNWGHLGGLLGGVAFAWFAGPLLEIGFDEQGPIFRDRHGDREAIFASVLVGMSFAVLALVVTLTRG